MGARIKHLQTLVPKAQISIAGGSVEEDFARLLYAPILFIEPRSSFGIFGGMANYNTVYSTPLLIVNYHEKEWTQPDFGPNWHWLDVPVLVPELAKKLNITPTKIPELVRWLQTA